MSGLISSISLLLSLGVIYGALDKITVKNDRLRVGLTGVLLGGVSILLMLTPWEFSAGIIFDARVVLFSLSAVFFGLTPTVIAMFMAIAFRYFQGGIGTTIGIAIIVSSVCYGALFNRLRARYSIALNWRNLYVFSLTVELIAIGLMFFLPQSIRFNVIEAVSPTLLIVYPIASTLLGMMLIHQRSRADGALKLKESRRLLAQERGALKGLIDSIPDLIFYKNVNSDYLGCNKSFEQFVGKSEQEIMASDDLSLFGEEKAREYQEGDNQVLVNKQASRDERWVELPDNPKALFETVKTPFYNNEGEILGIVGISRNITKRFEQDQLLRQSELTYRSIVTTAIDGFWIVSEDGRIEDVNKSYVEMSGYSSSELIGMPIEVLDTIYSQKDIESLGKAVRRGDEKIYTSKHRRKDGRIFDVEVNITYWKSDHDQQGKFFAFIRDVTQQKNNQEMLLKSEARFRRVFESIPKIAVQGYDKNREVIFWNKANESIYGYTEEEALGKKLEDLIIPDVARKIVADEVDDWLRGGEVTPASELVLWDKDSNPVTVFSTHVMISGHNNEREMYCIDIDLRAQKEAEQRAVTLSQALEQSPMSVIIANPDGIIEYVNGTFERSSGYHAHEIINQPISVLRSKRTPNAVYKQLLLSLRRGESWQGEFESVKKSGEVYWEQVHMAPVVGANNELSHYLAVTHDVTQQKEQEQKILHQAHFDHLSGLPNRFLSLDRLAQMMTEAKREKAHVAVLFLDFDDFKKVNDTLGHQVGDLLLVEAASRLSKATRASDVVGRLGGDEFIVIVKQEKEAGTAAIVAQKLLEQFRKPFVLEGREFVSTVSIGIAVYPEDGNDPAELLKQADSALYHSKDGGRDTYHFFTEQMNIDVARRVAVEEQLRMALDHGELFLNYQPLIDLNTNQVIGCEALIRWKNETLGFITPDEFIPIAEQTGLITDIGLFVVRTALNQVARWREHNPAFKVAINVSPIQFRDNTLQTEISRLLESLDLPASSIELEITEGVLISGYSGVEESLNQFNQLGISIAMDDFGTGYSSLSYLRQYPFDTLKVDRSFVDDMANDQSSLALVSATISMGHALGLSVVGEGIETQEQLTALVSLGCNIGQGYFLGRPTIATEFETNYFS